jgi:hypothetical protein
MSDGEEKGSKIYGAKYIPTYKNKAVENNFSTIYHITRYIGTYKCTRTKNFNLQSHVKKYLVNFWTL